MNRMIVPLMIPLVSGFAQALWAGSPAASKGQISQIQPKAQLVARAPLRRPSVLQQRLAAPPAALAQEKVQTPPAKNIRRLQVEGLLTDSKYKPLQGVYLLYFRFLDAQPGSRELWQSSMYVAVNDGAFRATLDVPESAAPRGSQGLRVSAEAPKGTGWIVKSKPYFVQVGSFESSERARELMSGLSPKFSRAFIAVSKLGAHQVRVGPFDRKADAEDAAGALQTLGHEVLVLREDR